MRLKGTALLAVGIAIALTGCSSVGSAAAPTAVARRVTPTSTPTPTPTVMSTAEAGAKYLAIVCPGNVASAAADAAFQKQDLASIKQSAATARDLYRSQAVALSDSTILWPESVKPELKTLADVSFADVSSFDAVANSSTLDQANAVAFNGGGGPEAQKVRALLGLPSDTTASCK